jgi:hypothetical protein
MCEAFLDACVAYSHDWLIPRVGLMKAGTCERSEVCAGITKVREDFFDTKFHDDTQASESTHETITISQHHECCVTTHCNKSDDAKKKKFTDADVWWQVWCDDEYDRTFNNDMMITTIRQSMKKKCMEKNLVTHDNDVKTTWYDMTWHDDDKMNRMYPISLWYLKKK